MTEWIAHRRLVQPDGTPLDVSISRPEPEGDAWRCAIRYVMGGAETLEHVDGVDAFQALTNALGDLEQDIAGRGATWLPSHPGWAGFHKIIPAGLEAIDVEELHCQIDALVERASAEALARRRKP